MILLRAETGPIRDSGALDAHPLWSLPTAAAACLRERRPIGAPIAGDAREETGLRGDSFMSPQHNAAAVDYADLSGRPGAYSPSSWIVEIEELTWQRQLDEIF